ncbi:MAG: ATP-dependent Clp protease adaptor ClpS [Planctomycetes bacterium]|nr:ATP-dependent Clp protease adaptor ClpS [Planctomycetota bacterium]
MSQFNNLQDEANSDGGSATAIKVLPKRPKRKSLPPWQVLLHNDDVNDIVFVADTIIELTTLNREDAVLRTLEAHQRGLALLLTTHREHAELLQEQFTSKRLSVTIEPSC